MLDPLFTYYKIRKLETKKYLCIGGIVSIFLSFIGLLIGIIYGVIPSSGLWLIVTFASVMATVILFASAGCLNVDIGHEEEELRRTLSYSGITYTEFMERVRNNGTQILRSRDMSYTEMDGMSGMSGAKSVRSY